MMDRRNLCDIARALFEDEENRDALYRAFLAGSAFMHGRLMWLVQDATYTDDNSLDPAMLEWVAKDMEYALRAKPAWEGKENKPAVPPARNVLSDARVRDNLYAIFGKGWNPARFDEFWKMFQADIMDEATPPAAREHMKGTYLAGISTAFYDIAKAYVLASNAKDPEAFRLYLRDFRRSLERVTQAPKDNNHMH